MAPTKSYERQLEWSSQVMHCPGELPAARIGVRFEIKVTCPCCRKEHLYRSATWSLLQRIGVGTQPNVSLIYTLITVSNNVGEKTLKTNETRYAPRQLGNEIRTMVRERFNCINCGVTFGLLRDEQERLTGEIYADLCLEAIEQIILEHDGDRIGEFNFIRNRCWRIVTQ